MVEEVTMPTEDNTFVHNVWHRN